VAQTPVQEGVKLFSMKKYTYKVLLKKEPEGGYTVTVPSLPGCLSYGESVEEAMNMAREAIELYIESLVAHNEPVPDESDTIEMEISLDIAV